MTNCPTNIQRIEIHISPRIYDLSNIAKPFLIIFKLTPRPVKTQQLNILAIILSNYVLLKYNYHIWDRCLKIKKSPMCYFPARNLIILETEDPRAYPQRREQSLRVRDVSIFFRIRLKASAYRINGKLSCVFGRHFLLVCPGQ